MYQGSQSFATFNQKVKPLVAAEFFSRRKNDVHKVRIRIRQWYFETSESHNKGPSFYTL